MTNIEILGHASPYALNGMPLRIADDEVKPVITFDVYDHQSNSWSHPQYRRVESHPNAPDVPRYAFIGCM